MQLFLKRGLLFSDRQSKSLEDLCLQFNQLQFNAWSICYSHRQYMLKSSLIPVGTKLDDFPYVYTWYSLVYGKRRKLPIQLQFMTGGTKCKAVELADQFILSVPNMKDGVKQDLFILCLKLQGSKRKTYHRKMPFLKFEKPDNNVPIYIGIYNSIRKFSEYIAKTYHIFNVSKGATVKNNDNVYNKKRLYSYWCIWTAQYDNIYNSCINWVQKRDNNSKEFRSIKVFVMQYLWRTCMEYSLHHFIDGSKLYISLVPQQPVSG